MTSVKLTNCDDLAMVKRGFASEGSVRQIELSALVDTGATMMAIPQAAADALGLSVVEHRQVTLADGTVKLLAIMGPLRIEILGRAMIGDAFVTPPGTTALIGQIPLEHLDLLVDPVSREVRVRLADGPVLSLMALAG